MNARPYILTEANWKSIRETPCELAVLPWGATEAHNYHLPYGTDNIQLDHIAAEAARIATEQGARPMVLPCVPFGVNTGQLDIPLCLNMNPSTQTAVLADIIDSLDRQGIGKLVILNGHGGNCFKQITRELQARFPQVFLSSINWFKVLDARDYFENPGDHADELETSLMLHLTPELVRPLEEAGDGATRAPRLRAIREGWAYAQRDWLKATVDTGSGDPSLATAEKGRAFFEALTEKLATYLVDVANADTSDLYEAE
jgi:creatinine amidohydrolase